MKQESTISNCPESEQLKQLALLVRQGRFFEVQDSLAAGKPFRAISYRSAKPLRDAAKTGFYSIIGLFLRQNLTLSELNEVLEEVVQLGREDLVGLLWNPVPKRTMTISPSAVRYGPAILGLSDCL